ncbi:hypothetical protein BGZ51_008917 [Haplosporangium sp. Z 767]|nr:hypothetical protein BGZ51_008917 [Haplosporangium sp. Z 767]KAF9191057.1 hypothetical protein BGZ50_009670 [Haplosporangium sp. Z 11]
MSDYTARHLVPSFSGIMAQIGLSIGINIVCIGFFEWNRRKKTMEHLYSPRCHLSVDPSPPVSLKFMGWVLPTLRMPEEFYINNVGLDAVMFLRFLKMCLQFCIVNAVIIGAILLPLHYNAGGTESEVQRMSIINVPDESQLLWAHVFLTYFISISWMFLLFKNYWQWMDLRREYTLQRIRQGEIAERSIFISRLPSNLRSDASLKQYFESLRMGPVESATVVQHCGRLSQKMDRRESTLNMLERAHIELARAVLESIKAGLFPVTTSNAALASKRSLGTGNTATTIDSSTSDYVAVQKMAVDLFRIRKLYNRTRKSVFSKKRQVLNAFLRYPQPNGNSYPPSPSSRPCDLVDIVMDQAMEPIPKRFQEPRSISPVTHHLWHALAVLDRRSLDPFQPTRTEKRFKGRKRVETIDYLLKKYNRLDRKVEELRDGTLQYKSTSFGFVTFRHHISAQLCAQSKIDSRPQGLSVSLAMEPRDVLWSNLTASIRNRLTRSVAVNISIWVLIVLWIFPTSSFLLLTSLGALSSRFAFLKPILTASPLIQSLLQNVLPIIFVSIFLAFAPVIIFAISKQELPVSHSALEGNVLRRYYHFLIFNILFVFMIGTAVLKSVTTLFQKPTNVFTLLANSLPAGSTFFIFYIVFSTCTHFLELVQVWAQLVIHAMATARKLARTPRSLQRAITPWCFQYYYYYPQNILSFVITLIYSIINPLILMAAIFYFAFALLVFKYQFAYCYVRKYENSGRYFRYVFQYTSDGLIIFQVTMIGVLWLKQAIIGGFFIVALLGMTVYFKILCGNLFRSRTEALPLDTCLRRLDTESNSVVAEPRTSTEDIHSSQTHMTGIGSSFRRRHTGNARQNNGEDPGIVSTHNLALEHKVMEPGHVKSNVRLQSAVGGQSDRYRKLEHNEWVNGLSGVSTTSEREREHAQTGEVSGTNDLVRCTQDYTKSEFEMKRDSTVEGAMAADVVIPEGPDKNSNGFLATNGNFARKRRSSNALHMCSSTVSHFEHKSSRISYQDRTSEFETYIHPALLKPLNRKLWLPRNPLYEHWDLDDTVEVDIALCSSSVSSKVSLRVKGAENPLGSLRLPYVQYPQRRHTGGSYIEGGIGGAPPSASVWHGCLDDSNAEDVECKQKEVSHRDITTRRPIEFVGRSNTSGPAVVTRNSIRPPSLAHSASQSSTPALPSLSLRTSQYMSELETELVPMPKNITRNKRSSSMPTGPAQMTLSPLLSSSPISFDTSIASQGPLASPLVPPNTTPFRIVSPLRSLSYNVSTSPQIPGISLVTEVTKVQSPLPVRSTMFGASLLYPNSGGRPYPQQNNSSSGISSMTGSPGVNIPLRGPGGFLNMIFGRYDDDDVYDDKTERSQFGYETGGMWSARRGSRDHRDDEDDDDEDDDEDNTETEESRQEDQLRNSHARLTGTDNSQSNGKDAEDSHEMQSIRSQPLEFS